MYSSDLSLNNWIAARQEWGLETGAALRMVVGCTAEKFRDWARKGHVEARHWPDETVEYVMGDCVLVRTREWWTEDGRGWRASIDVLPLNDDPQECP